MEDVGAALADHVDHRSASGTEFRGKVAGLNRHLFHCIHGRLRFHRGAQQARSSGDGCHAIQAHLNSIRRRSVDHHGGNRTGIGIADSGDQAHRYERIAEPLGGYAHL